MTPKIRLATPDDAADVHAIYSPIVRDTAISFELEPPSCDEMRARIESTLARYPWLVCDVDGVVAGYAYAGAHRVRAAYLWAVDVSTYNHAAYRHRGVGRALYTALLAIVRAQGFRQACAGITLPNVASIALHETLGFERVGVYPDIGYKLGAWHGVGWWQAQLFRDDEPPSAPVWLVDLDASVLATALDSGAPVLRL